MDNNEPYIPFYHRPPNKFIEYQEVEFTTDYNGSGIERFAIFKTKDGKMCKATSQIIWKHNPTDKRS